MAAFGEAAELACVGAARQAALLAFGADPETAAPAERRGKGLAKAFASPRADFCLKQTALPCLEADVSVAAARLAAFPGDKPSAEAALAPLAAAAVAVAAAGAPLPLGSDASVAVAGAGPALAVAVFAGGALVAAVDASALGAATEVARGRRDRRGRGALRRRRGGRDAAPEVRVPAAS